MDIKTPEPEKGIPESWQQKGTGEKLKREKIRKIGCVVLALAGIGGALLTGCSGDTSSAAMPTATPTATVEPPPIAATPEQTLTPTTTAERALTYEQQVAALEIPAGLSAEELAETLVAERWTLWVNYGVETEAKAKRLREDWFAYGKVMVLIPFRLSGTPSWKQTPSYFRRTLRRQLGRSAKFSVVC